MTIIKMLKSTLAISMLSADLAFKSTKTAG